METRQIVRPIAAQPLPAYEDTNRLTVATPHWAIQQKRIAPGGSYAGVSVEISVPTGLTRRQVYAHVQNENGNTDIGTCLGEVHFFQAGNKALVLPFDFLPGVVAGVNAIGFHVSSPSVSTNALNTLGVDIGNVSLLLQPWQIDMACQRIRIELRSGTANLTDGSYIILGCLSQPIL
jgi:hypothetical protein